MESPLRNKFANAGRKRSLALGAANHDVEVGEEGVHLVHNVALHSLGPLLAAVRVRQQRHQKDLAAGGRAGERAGGRAGGSRAGWERGEAVARSMMITMGWDGGE